jgi:hypothetical protein
MKAQRSSADCLSDLVLDTWSAGELDAPARERAAQHIATCARCRQRQADAQTAREAFYTAAPSFEQHAARFVHGRQGAPATRSRALTLSGVVVALAAAAFLALKPGATTDTRSKGAPSLGYFVKRAGRVFVGAPSTLLHPGDLVRFTYHPTRPGYFAVLNRDARTASVYFPSGPRAAPVQAGRSVALDFSVELDEVLGDEQVFGVFCPTEFAIAPLLAALRETGQVRVETGCRLAPLVLHKVAAR